MLQCVSNNKVSGIQHLQQTTHKGHWYLFDTVQCMCAHTYPLYIYTIVGSSIPCLYCTIHLCAQHHAYLMIASENDMDMHDIPTHKIYPLHLILFTLSPTLLPLLSFHPDFLCPFSYLLNLPCPSPCPLTHTCTHTHTRYTLYHMLHCKCITVHSHAPPAQY